MLGVTSARIRPFTLLDLYCARQSQYWHPFLLQLLQVPHARTPQHNMWQ